MSDVWRQIFREMLFRSGLFKDRNCMLMSACRKKWQQHTTDVRTWGGIRKKWGTRWGSDCKMCSELVHLVSQMWWKADLQVKGSSWNKGFKYFQKKLYLSYKGTILCWLLTHLYPSSALSICFNNHWNQLFYWSCSALFHCHHSVPLINSIQMLSIIQKEFAETVLVPT